MDALDTRPPTSRPPDRLLHRVPPVPRRPLSFPVELALTRAAIVVTLVLAAVSAWSLVDWLRHDAGPVGPSVVAGQVLFVVGGAVLLYGSMVYMVARLGYLRRTRDVRPAGIEELASIYDGPAPRLAILVPSYREDPHLVRMTLVSAALQAFPRHRVVLLVDDPPAPTEPSAVDRLELVRRVPAELQAALDEPARRMASAAAAYRDRAVGRLDRVDETRRVAALWDEAAAWLEAEAAAFLPTTHVERFFRREVLEAPAATHRATAAELRWRAVHDPLGPAQLRRHHARLVGLFDVELTAFERKRWSNLSHAPNKAMNLNSYIQLLGTTSRIEHGPDGPALVTDPDGEVHVPAADHLITLDADSLLLPRYALQLVHHMEQPGNERVGLVQTPYSAFPDAPGAVERVAGATTDIMCLVHQGSSHYDAAYWVGANAVLRVEALRDIAEVDTSDPHRRVTRFIRDRTLVEDTESTIDLVRRGWGLVNYPARLAYSATPADFGSLLIQRRRWANGGLLVLPGLLRSVRERRPSPLQLTGILMRLSYLTSLATVNVAFLLLMEYSFEGVHAPVWLPLLAVPYFLLYARDLVQAGYRTTDVVRVYALTLLLIPVHLGGVARSLQQAWTGRQTAFRRTPKVATRTPVPALYVVATFLLVGSWLVATADDLGSDRNARAVFTTVNVALLLWAVSRFLGWRASLGDLWLRVTGSVGRWVTLPVVPEVGRRRAWYRRPAAVAGRLALVPLLLVGGVTAHAWLEMRNAPVEGLSSSPFGRMNVLVAGVDSRAGLSDEQLDELALGDFEGSRADSIFLLSVQGGRAAMLAFPRDLLVERCDGSEGRINESLEVGGPSCLVEAVEERAGVAVNHYVQVDVTGLVDVVDAVGGVPMTLERDIVDDKTDADFDAGPNWFDGADALRFVRVRSIDDDLGRIGRQQDFVESLATELAGPRTLMRPWTGVRVVAAAAGAMTVDADTGPIDMARLGWGLSRAIRGDDLVTATVPTDPVTVAGEELLVESEDAARAYRRFADGTMLGRGGDPRLAGR